MHADQVRSILPGITVNVPTSNTQLLPRRKNRYQAFIQNSHSSTALRIGSPDELTAGDGIPLAAGEILDYRGPGPISAIAASGTVDVFVVETVAGANIADTPKERRVAVTSSRPLILPKDKQRQFAIIHNTDGSNDVAIGGFNRVYLTGGGIILNPGQRIMIVGPAPVWAIAGGTNEVQTLTFSGTITSGTYDLTWEDFTVTLAYNADAAAIQAALRTNPLLAPDNVNVTGTGPFTITFVKEQGARDVEAIVIDNTDLVGGGSGAITTPTPGVALSVEVAIREERRF